MRQPKHPTRTFRRECDEEGNDRRCFDTVRGLARVPWSGACWADKDCRYSRQEYSRPRKTASSEGSAAVPYVPTLVWEERAETSVQVVEEASSSMWSACFPAKRARPQNQN